MYYHTPNTTPFIQIIKRFRAIIISIFTLLSIAALWTLKAEIISSDTMLWLSDSKQLDKTRAREYSPSYVTHVRVHIGTFDDKAKDNLQKFQSWLQTQNGIANVESLFSSYMIFNDHSGEESALVKALSLSQMNAVHIRDFVHSFPEPYRRFVTPDFKEFRFIIHSNQPIRLEHLDIPYSYDVSTPSVSEQVNHYLVYAGVLVLVMIVMFRLIFKNYIAAFGAICVTAITLIWTFWLISRIDSAQIHIAMSLLVVSISISHYLYYYYRWHVSQLKNDANRALDKSINRNLYPALWTLPALIISLGSLLFADSPIVTMMSLSLMISTVVAYGVNILFLPALLSYFSVQNPKMSVAKTCYWFANREVHYNPKILKFFIGMTAIVFIFLGYRFSSSSALFEHDVNYETMTLKVPFQEIDLGMIQKIEALENDLNKHIHGSVKMDSVVSVLRRLDLANTPANRFDEQRLLQALFFLELYDLENTYIDSDALNITITLSHANQSEVIDYLENYKSLPLYLTDINTLTQSSKMEKTLILGSSLLIALIIIGVVMGMVFHSWRVGLVGFAANAIPIIWFILFMYLFKFELSIEALIAMSISVGLTSDTVIHFGYKYFRSRHFGRTRKHALEIMFFYAGLPAIIGAIVLMVFFALLSFTQLQSLQLIGSYGSVLMLISLLSDLFVLPVLLLTTDQKHSVFNDMHATLPK